MHAFRCIPHVCIDGHGGRLQHDDLCGSWAACGRSIQVRGGYIGLDTWRNREWYPVLEATGISKRGPYHLRHTFATEALAAGVSIFELARLMGTSVKEIDKTYGHLARDSEEAIRARLDAKRRGRYEARGGAAMSEREPRRVVVYMDVIEFHGSPPQDGERVVLVRGDGPREGAVMTWATVRHHSDDGRPWIYADDESLDPFPLVEEPAP